MARAAADPGLRGTPWLPGPLRPRVTVPCCLRSRLRRPHSPRDAAVTSEAAVTAAGKLPPGVHPLTPLAVAVPSPRRAPDVSLGGHRVAPARPACSVPLLPSRRHQPAPLPSPGTSVRAGGRAPSSWVAAGALEEPSSYGEGPSRPLKMVRPKGCGHTPGTQARFPGRTTLRTGRVVRGEGSCHSSYPRAGSQFTHIGTCHHSPWGRHSEKCSLNRVGCKGQTDWTPQGASQSPLQG